ncbi:MAG: barstar family protein [Phycisphaerales bacterium]|nr:barstar family protein [Phycisphaerales bacterium]
MPSHPIILDPGIAWPPSAAHAKVYSCDGTSMTTRQSLFRHLRGSLALPSYCANNWDSLSECMSDMEWSMSEEVCIHIDAAEFALSRAEAHDALNWMRVLFDVCEEHEPVVFAIVLRPSNTQGHAILQARARQVAAERATG